jgi:multiphosphoryl transfer protein
VGLVTPPADPHGPWVGVCGELAGEPAAAALLVGLGVTELSMAPAVVPEVKEVLRRVELGTLRGVAEAALSLESADEARAKAAEAGA